MLVKESRSQFGSEKPLLIPPRRGGLSLCVPSAPALSGETVVTLPYLVVDVVSGPSHGLPRAWKSTRPIGLFSVSPSSPAAQYQGFLPSSLPHLSYFSSITSLLRSFLFFFISSLSPLTLLCHFVSLRGWAGLPCWTALEEVAALNPQGLCSVPGHLLPNTWAALPAEIAAAASASLAWSNLGPSFRTNIWAERGQSSQITWGNRQGGRLGRALTPVLSPWLSRHYLTA